MDPQHYTVAVSDGQKWLLLIDCNGEIWWRETPSESQRLFWDSVAKQIRHEATRG